MKNKISLFQHFIRANPKRNPNVFFVPYQPTQLVLNTNIYQLLYHPWLAPQENDTNFGSSGRPSGLMPFLANLCSVTILRASSNPIFLLFIIFATSLLPCWSSPARESPTATFDVRSKLLDVKPDSISLEKDEGRR